MTSDPACPETRPALETLDIQKILRLLPHRYPFIMVDRVTELVRGEYIKAYKNVTINEPFFSGHFPDAPVMPGVLILEAMAQTVGMLVLVTESITVEDKLFLFTSMEGVRFRRPVRPGDRIDMHCSILRSRLNMWKNDCKAYVDGALAAEGILTAAVTLRQET
jgi:3-hydroxyacyl-[acyl-carrier-protein] dehydratase